VNLPKQIDFIGPFALHTAVSGATSLFDSDSSGKPGVYLWTILDNNKQYVPFYIGISHKSIAARTRAHLKNYLCGMYRVYDVIEMRNLKRDYPVHDNDKKENIELFIVDARKKLDQTMDMLDNTRVFYCPLETDKEVLKRIESGLITGYKEELKNKFIENLGVSKRTPEGLSEKVIIGAPPELRNICSIDA